MLGAWILRNSKLTSGSEEMMVTHNYNFNPWDLKPEDPNRDYWCTGTHFYASISVIIGRLFK